MSHRAAHDRSSASRKYDSGRPATVVDASIPHSSVLPVRGVAQIKYESKRPVRDELSQPLPGRPTLLFMRQSCDSRSVVGPCRGEAVPVGNGAARASPVVHPLDRNNRGDDIGRAWQQTVDATGGLRVRHRCILSPWPIRAKADASRQRPSRHTDVSPQRGGSLPPATTVRKARWRSHRRVLPQDQREGCLKVLAATPEAGGRGGGTGRRCVGRMGSCGSRTGSSRR